MEEMALCHNLCGGALWLWVALWVVPHWAVFGCLGTYMWRKISAVLSKCHNYGWVGCPSLGGVFPNLCRQNRSSRG